MAVRPHADGVIVTYEEPSEDVKVSRWKLGWMANRRFFGTSTLNADIPFWGLFLITLAVIKILRHHVLLGYH